MVEQFAKNNYFDGHTTNKIFSSQEPLNPQIIPEKGKFVGRDEEIQRLVNLLKYLAQGDNPENLLATGNTGYGKTASIKLVLEDLKQKMSQSLGEEITTVYMSDAKSQNEVLCRISEEMELGTGEAGYTQAKNNSKHYRLLKNKIIEDDKKVLLVVDEIDKLFKDSRTDHGNELLKQLFEIRGDVMNKSDGCLVIIGITNDVSIDEEFDPRVKSRFEDNEIQFPPYNALELRKILDIRAQEAFKSGVIKDGVISKASALVAQEDGDARKAIQMLKKAGQIADNKDEEEVKKKHVDQAKDEIERNRTMEAVENLPKQEKIVFYAILKMNQKKAVTGEVFSEYKSACKRHDINPVTQRRVQELLDDLDMLGLINEKVKNVSNGRGRTREIKHNHSEGRAEEMKEYLEDDLSLV